MRTLLSSLVLAALIGAVLLRAVVASRQEASTAVNAVAADAIRILEARPFVVDEPFVHEWRREKPLARAGYLIALAVPPELARPRQTFEPVLYVGTETAERCATDEANGVMVVLVPAPLAPDGQVALDLATAPIWFGRPELPERVDEAHLAGEVAWARASGVEPARPGAGVELRFGAGEAIHARTRWELDSYVEDWLARHGSR